ncbi:hypothetical protein JOE48_003504 [Methylobacterium sp. PvR107]|nr:hypothetical protein [Methylobacterium sp. PvR107]
MPLGRRLSGANCRDGRVPAATREAAPASGVRAGY